MLELTCLGSLQACYKVTPSYISDKSITVSSSLITGCLPLHINIFPFPVISAKAVMSHNRGSFLSSRLLLKKY